MTTETNRRSDTKRSGLTLSRRQLQQACDAWGRTPDTGSGCTGLGLWLSRHKPHYSVADYAELIALVRAELGDTTDYSGGQAGPSAPPSRPNEYIVPEDATPTACRSCGAGMVFVKTPAGKALPLSVATIQERDGVRWALAHFADCKDAKTWSKR